MNTRYTRVLFLLIGLIGLSIAVEAGVPGVDVGVPVSARVTAQPPSITLSWPVTPSAGITYRAHTLYRKAPGAADWGQPLARLDGTAAGYTDTGVKTGVAYEYQVVREAVTDGGVTFSGYGYVCAGIAVPPVENPGTVLLLVDARQAVPLQAELARLQHDLVGDGWQVVRHDIDPAWTDQQVKALIVKDYKADPAGVHAVFLVGHVAVPYSGNIAPDGHGDHQGAWPADLYYGDMTGTWTDTTVDNSTVKLRDARNRNVPRDGKWDQDHVPEDGQVALCVGRVDMANLPAFAPLTETELLRRYLDKDHAYRFHLPPYDTVLPRALCDDNAGLDIANRAYIMALATGGDAMLGQKATDVTDWIQAFATKSYTWGFGYTVGSFDSLGGIINTGQSAKGPVNVVFATGMGSYSGDWDVSNSVLRALIASQPLCVGAGGGCNWYLHPLAMGCTIGDAVRLTQNNRGLYPNPWATPFSANNMNMVEISWLGDPTLHLLPIAAPSRVVATPAGAAMQLTWAAAPQAAGYCVYRATRPDGPFTRLDTKPVTTPAFTDPAPPANAIYLVRALQLQTTGGGTVYTLSQGAFSGDGSAPANAAGASLSKIDAAKVSVTQYGADDRVIGQAAELTDGNARSRWLCNNPEPPLRLACDLGTARTVGKLRIANYFTGQNFDRGIKVVDIFVGDAIAPLTGGTPAVMAQELKISDAAGPAWTEIPLDKPVKGRIVTLRVQSNWGGKFYAANEVEIYTQEADTPATPAAETAKPPADPNAPQRVVYSENPIRLVPDHQFTLTFPDMPPTFQNQVQNTGRPAKMTVYLPKNYDPARKHPLLLFLCGSNGSDGGMIGTARTLSEEQDFVCIDLPFFKVNAKDAIIRDDDCKLMWPLYNIMLTKLMEVVPNIDPTHRIIGGFSNGAHTTGGLIDNSNGEAAKWFSAFILVEGGGRTQRYDLIKGKPVLFCYGYQPGREQVRTRMQQIGKAAGDAGVKVTVHEMSDTGHGFPDKEFPFVRQWLREVALK